MLNDLQCQYISSPDHLIELFPHGFLQVLILSVQPFAAYRTEPPQTRQRTGKKELAKLGLHSEGYFVMLLRDVERGGLRPYLEIFRGLALCNLGEGVNSLRGFLEELLFGHDGVLDEEGKEFVHRPN